MIGLVLRYTITIIHQSEAMRLVYFVLASQLSLVACLSLKEAACDRGNDHPGEDGEGYSHWLEGLFGVQDPDENSVPGRGIDLNADFPDGINVTIYGKDSADGKTWNETGMFNMTTATVVLYSSPGNTGTVTPDNITWSNGTVWIKKKNGQQDDLLWPAEDCASDLTVFRPDEFEDVQP